MPRGGARQNSGRKKKPLADKLLEGNPGHRTIQTIQFDGIPLESELQAPSFLSLASKETADNFPTAADLFNDLTAWLQGTGCLHLISPTLIEDFCLNRRAYFECEYMNKRLGRIAGGRRSPYVDMAALYAGLMRTAWDRMWSIISQNSEKSYNSHSSFGIDIMEQLLSRRD
ncbi:hypothetical protein FACS18948_4420 [Clostridia bacterium]|nr:hypothetical protein FACS18948_4420 [Clostridia bacterium]